MKQFKKCMAGAVLAVCLMAAAGCTNKDNNKDTSKQTEAATEKRETTKETTMKETNAVTENMTDTNNAGNVNDATDGTNTTGSEGLLDELGDDIKDGARDIKDDLEGDGNRTTENGNVTEGTTGTNR